MKNYLFGFILILSAFSFSAHPQAAQTSKNYQFINGRWFDGKQFKQRRIYSINGVFSDRKQARIDETIDLKNGYVIPPFADAHTHNLDGIYNLEANINSYLKEGTFYVQVLGNYKTGADAAKKDLNKPDSLDVIYANGCLTSTLGHPFMAYEPRALGLYNPATWKENIEKIKKSRIGENNVYWFLDSKADVDKKFDKIIAQNSDIIKIMLLDAENYENLHNNGNAGDKGLSPEVAAYVVGKLHAAGKKVFAHIETVNDFRLGLKIGVDGFAHAPGYNWNGDEKTRSTYELTDKDIELAAKKKIVVTPTARIGEFYAAGRDDITYAESKETRIQKNLAAQKNLLEKMQRKGVIIALGSDNFGHYLGEEIEYLYKNNFFDNLTLLKIAVETTPQIIFPARKIGKLENGYEASFLVLNGDPLKNFEQTKNISLRFKQGSVINVK